ncbi:MAG: transposase [Desulfatibacillaceae bacterium]|nr:transposase [Desulfatibacillaceae bacterium]
MRYRRARAKGGTYFFTVVTFARRKFLAAALPLSILREAFARTMADRPFEVDAWVIMPDHMHFIWTLPEGDLDFSTRWRLIKARFTNSFRERASVSQDPSRALKSEWQVWQRRYWEHQVRDEADFIRCVEYIHYNPVKHGVAKAPVEWPHSSFHKFVKEGKVHPSWAKGGLMEMEDDTDDYGE